MSIYTEYITDMVKPSELRKQLISLGADQALQLCPHLPKMFHTLEMTYMEIIGYLVKHDSKFRVFSLYKDTDGTARLQPTFQPTDRDDKKLDDSMVQWYACRAGKASQFTLLIFPANDLALGMDLFPQGFEFEFEGITGSTKHKVSNNEVLTKYWHINGDYPLIRITFDCNNPSLQLLYQYQVNSIIEMLTC